MIWWHAAHFALWGNDELLEKNLEWFQKQLPAARGLAKERGLRGARWAKMTGPDMRESPGGNPLIIWNQPHMVYLSELLHRNNPTRRTLDKYRDLVLETAECLASMVHFDEKKGVYVLGPLVDRATMERTLDAVLKSWDWVTNIWGGDYPMIAMTAARLGRPEIAVEILRRDGPNNRYLPNGHCPQRSDEALPKNPQPGARKREIAVYLPANGAFLTAVAMMAAGWDGQTGDAPGFPKDGKWKIRIEGLNPLL